MLAMEIKLSLETRVSFWRKPALLFRALLAIAILNGLEKQVIQYQQWWFI